MNCAWLAQWSRAARHGGTGAAPHLGCMVMRVSFGESWKKWSALYLERVWEGWGGGDQGRPLLVLSLDECSPR